MYSIFDRSHHDHRFCAHRTYRGLRWGTWYGTINRDIVQVVAFNFLRKRMGWNLKFALLLEELLSFLYLVYRSSTSLIVAQSIGSGVSWDSWKHYSYSAPTEGIDNLQAFSVLPCWNRLLLGSRQSRGIECQWYNRHWNLRLSRTSLCGSGFPPRTKIPRIIIITSCFSAHQCSIIHPTLLFKAGPLSLSVV